jgi:general stress protein 26
VKERTVAEKEPTAELDPRFGDEGATATPWSDARELLETSKVYWISTVRPDGRPHVTSIAAVWLDGALHFTTGESERKAKNLRTNTQVVITTGCNVLDGLDVVVEGQAALVTDEAKLRRLAEAYTGKYGQLFGFQVRDGALWAEGSDDPGRTFEVRARKAFGFGKGELFSQTRWLFGSS